MLHRSRLYERLNAWTPLTTICAPAGYGKTVLLASWLERVSPNLRASKTVTLWVQLDAEIAERDVFWQHIAGLLAGAGLTGADEQFASPEQLQRDLPRRMTASARPVLLVLDNFEHIQDDQLHGELLGLVRRCRLLHVFLCSRRLPPCTSVDTNAISANELLLTSVEFHDLADELGISLTDSDAARLHHATGGWIQPVRAALASYHDQANLDTALRAAEASVYYALSPRTPNSLLSFLLQWSLVEELTHESALTATAEDNTHAMVGQLIDLGIVHPVATSGDPTTYELPAITRTVLRRTIETEQPAQAIAVRQRLCSWHRQSGRPMPALSHAVAAQHWAATADIIDEHWLELVLVHDDEFRRLIANLPPAAMSREPRLQMSAYLIRHVADGDYNVAAPYPLDNPAARTLAVNPRLRDTLAIGTSQSTALFLAGRLDQALSLLEQLETSYERATTEAKSSLTNLVPLLQLQWALLRLMAGAHDHAIQLALAAYHAGLDGDVEGLARHAAGVIALCFVLQGSLPAARSWQARAEQHSDHPMWTKTILRGAGTIATGLLAIQTLDQRTCRQSLQQLDDPSTQNVLWPLIAYLRAQYALLYGEPRSARAELNAARAVHPAAVSKKGIVAALFASIDAKLLLATGHHSQATKALAKHQPADPLIEIAHARTELFTGHFQAAVKRADTLISHAQTAPGPLLDMLAIKATAESRSGAEAEARNTFTLALAVGYENDHYRPFALMPHRDLDRLLTIVPAHSLRDNAIPRLDRDVFGEPSPLVSLTDRELQVLKHLRTASPLQTIAADLYISVTTLKTHIRSIYRKFGTHSRRQTLAEATRQGLL